MVVLGAFVGFSMDFRRVFCGVCFQGFVGKDF